MIRLVLAIIALSATSYAIYTDFRYRYIDDWLTWGLVGFGLAGHAVISLVEWSYVPILYSLCAAAIFFVLANILFRVGAYGGGDVKLMIGLAATVPLYPEILRGYLPVSLVEWPFLVTVLLNIFFVGLIYTLIYLIAKAALNYNKFKKNFSKHFSNVRKPVYLVLASLVVPIVLAFFNLEAGITVAALIALLILSFVLTPFSKAVEEVMMYVAKPSELEAGDRPADKIKIRGRLVYKPRRIGLTSDDLKKLQALEKLGKLDKIKVKDGVPFAPAIFLGLLCSLVLGDLLLILVESLL